MKKSVAVVIIYFVQACLFSLHGQSIQVGDFKNKKAVLFSIDGLNLGTLHGGLGYKKGVSSYWVLCNTIQVNYAKNEKEKNNNGNGIEDNHFSIGTTFGLIKHSNVKNKLSLFWGGSVGGGYEKIEHKVIPNDVDNYYYYRSQYINETKTTIVNLSLHFILGVEYFIKNNISIEGQYKVGGNYGFGKEKTKSNIVDADQNISVLKLGIWSSSIILSIYL
jgi:hypothetical protein